MPGPVYEIPGFTRAVDRGTRTRTGAPGAGYWVQHARYTIEGRLDVATNRVSGHERVIYLNNSPDTLRRIAVYLRQNVFAAGSPRREEATDHRRRDPGPVVGGRCSAGSRSRRAESPWAQRRARRCGYTVDGTVMWIPLASPLVPHDSTRLEFAWSYVPPPSPSDGREGREGHHVYFMGYWYPQIAVYDDVNGWVTDPYVLEAEFYMDPADYDVRLTVPHGWPVGATGKLENAGEVLSPAALAKLAEARRTGRVVHVVGAGPVRRRRRSRPVARPRPGTSPRPTSATSRGARATSMSGTRRARWSRTREAASTRPRPTRSTSTASTDSPSPRRRGRSAARASRATRSSNSPRTSGPIRGRR